MVTHLQGSYGKDKWMGESTTLGMLVRVSSARSIPICVRGRHQIGWEKAQFGTHVEKIGDTR